MIVWKLGKRPFYFCLIFQANSMRMRGEVIWLLRKSRAKILPFLSTESYGGTKRYLILLESIQGKILSALTLQRYNSML